MPKTIKLELGVSWGFAAVVGKGERGCTWREWAGRCRARRPCGSGEIRSPSSRLGEKHQFILRLVEERGCEIETERERERRSPRITVARALRTVRTHTDDVHQNSK